MRVAKEMTQSRWRLRVEIVEVEEHLDVLLDPWLKGTIVSAEQRLPFC